ncbi:MAG TPA: phosphatase PAP2 family protein [Gammaproteobacteria bacterium]|nr:phosphatase PAP2 family protein [Gammaproteobacteria bacterium]
MLHWLQEIIAWITQHPQLAGLAVFLVALSESLAVVGLVVPGAAMMFGAGALIATGALDFWSTFWLAVLGAVLGDGLSYALGRRYHQQLRQMWPFRRHPAMLARGESFFREHGGKSVIIARFIGPVRPVLPVVAGMLDMPARRFFSVNLLSALAWAPAYLLPGMAFGASLAIAGEVAGRLALMLALLLALFWLLFGLARRLYRWLQPHAREWGERLLKASRKRPWSAWLVAGLFDPQRRASTALLVWLLLLLGGTWLFLGVLEDVLTDDPLVSAGYGLYQLLQGLRTPLADEIMVGLSALGDTSVILTVVASVMAYQLWRRQWHEVLYWLASLGFALIAVTVLKAGLQFPRPIDLYRGVENFSFPSGHATFAVVVYGYLAMLIAAHLPLRWHWLSYACGSILIGGIAFSRLYLGAHWLADVAAGFGLGTAWVALLAIARHYHLPTHLPTHLPAHSPEQNKRRSFAPGLVLVSLCSLALAGAWHITRSMDADLARYAIRHHQQNLSRREWLDGAWQQLPAYRIDLEGEQEQPLNIQLAGEITALRDRLLALGWQEPLPVTPRSAMYWFAPEAQLAALPVLPQIHNGHRESLLLVKHTGDHHLVLRLWSSTTRLMPGDIPLWLGTVANLRLQCLPLLCFPRTGKDYDTAQKALAGMLKALPQWQRQRKIDTEKGAAWQGRVLLMQSVNRS